MRRGACVRIVPEKRKKYNSDGRSCNSAKRGEGMGVDKKRERWMAAPVEPRVAVFPRKQQPFDYKEQ